MVPLLDWLMFVCHLYLVCSSILHAHCDSCMMLGVIASYFSLLHHLSHVAFMHSMAWLGDCQAKHRIERSSHSKWCNSPQFLVTKALDQHMIRLWISFACIACIYIKMKPWFFGLSCIEMHHWWPKNQESYLLESPSMIGGNDHAYMSPKTHAMHCCLAAAVKLSSAGTFCRPAENSADRHYFCADKPHMQPVANSSSR